MNDFALTHLYHPTGAKVSVPLSPDSPLSIEQAKNLMASVDILVNIGFAVNLPGLEDGEHFEQIGFVVRRETVNDDSSVTPIVDLYPVDGKFRHLGVYLNSPDDVSNFEAACGKSLASMPLYDGAPIERGKNPRLDPFVVRLEAPAKMVWKQNPKWEGDEDKKHQKRVFVRWEGLRPKVMTLAEAESTLSPGGQAIGSLDAEKLVILANSRAANITEEMRQAAKTILESESE